MAAFASSVAASIPSRWPFSNSCSARRFSTPSNTAGCVSRSIRSRARLSELSSGEPSPGASPRNARSDSESAQRHAICRSLGSFSKYPTGNIRKYTPGGTGGRPSFAW